MVVAGWLVRWLVVVVFLFWGGGGNFGGDAIGVCG